MTLLSLGMGKLDQAFDLGEREIRKALCISSMLSPRSKLFTMGSGMMRVPRTMGLPDTLPGILSISSHCIQSISDSMSAAMAKGSIP